MVRKSIYLPTGLHDSVRQSFIPDAAIRGDFFFSGGIPGYDDSGNLPSENISQGEKIYARLRRLLELAGFTPEEVGHLFIWALERHPAIGGKVGWINRYWEDMFPEITDRPARHVLGRPLDTGLHYRIEILAIKGCRRKDFEVSENVYHLGGSETPGYMPFGMTIGDYFFTGPTYGMYPETRKIAETAETQAAVCTQLNEKFYSMAGHSKDNLGRLWIWYHDDAAKAAAIRQTELSFPDVNDRPAIHYLKSKLPYWDERQGQFLIQYDNVGVGGVRRKVVNVNGVEVLDGERGNVPAAVVMDKVLFGSPILGKGTLSEQILDALKGARAAVEAGGFDWEDVGHVYVWVREMDDREAIDMVWEEAFPDKELRPVRHVIHGPELPPEHKVAVEVTAAR